jgi:hypothetical protein
MSSRHGRRRRQRTGVALLATVLLALAAAAGAAAEPLSPTDPLYSPSAPLVDENPYVSAEYSGTLTQTAASSTVPTRSVSANLSWNTKVSGPVDQIEYAATYGASAIHWEVSELTGSVKVTNEKAPSCSGSFSATGKDGGTRGIELPADEPGFPAGGGNPATNPDYRVDPPQGIPLILLASSAGLSGECGTTIWDASENWFGGALSQPGWESAAGPIRYFPPGAPFTDPINPPAYECACGPGQTFKVTLTSTLKFTSPVLPGGSAPTGGPSSGTGQTAPGPTAPGPPVKCGAGSKPSCESKKAAQEDIRRELRPTTFECELAAVGIGGIIAALAAPEVSAAAFLAAEGVVGAEVAALAGTTCGLLLKRIYEDAKTVEDPPAGQLGKLAEPTFPKRSVIHPPACARYPKALQFCKRLRAQILAYAASVADGQAVTAALLTTVDRITGAELAHNSSALARQARHAGHLHTQLAARYAAQRRAGRAISQLFSGAHFSASISAAQAHAGLAGVLSKLGGRGISAAGLAKVAAAALPEGSIAAEPGFGG